MSEIMTPNWILLNIQKDCFDFFNQKDDGVTIIHFSYVCLLIKIWPENIIMTRDVGK